MAARSPACRFGRTQTASSSGNRPFESTGRSAGTSTPREHCRNQDRKTARTELRELGRTDRLKLRRVRRLAAYSHRTVVAGGGVVSSLIGSPCWYLYAKLV